MTDKPDNQIDRIERLLQQWGADEAERNANPPAMPRLDGAQAGRASASRRVLRWAPLAAAAVVLAAGVAMYTGPTFRQAMDASAPQAAKAPGQYAATAPPGQPDTRSVRSLQKEVADLREQLAVANAKVAGLSGLASEIANLRGRLERLGQEQAAEVKRLEATTADERKARLEQAKQLDAARLRVAELETAQRVLQTASAEGAEAKKQAADLKQRLAAAGEELTLRRRAEEAAEAKLTDARQDAQRLELRHREIVEAFQRTYLASVAPGQSGLEARKTAVRARQMIQRLASLSGEVKSDQTRQVLDRLEAVLTRLDLMNANRPDSRESFSRLVTQGDLERQIDAALAAPGQAEDVKNWLFEAKLILMGGPNAG
jgi:flagellar basal body-associated protein FliL